MVCDLHSSPYSTYIKLCDLLLSLFYLPVYYTSHFITYLQVCYIPAHIIYIITYQLVCYNYWSITYLQVCYIPAHIIYIITYQLVCYNYWSITYLQVYHILTGLLRILLVPVSIASHTRAELFGSNVTDFFGSEGVSHVGMLCLRSRNGKNLREDDSISFSTTSNVIKQALKSHHLNN